MTSKPFAFEDEAIKKAENDFSLVKMDPFQEQGTIRMCGVINQHLNMNVLALRGFWYQAVKAWQEESGRFLSDTMTDPLEERLIVLKYLLTHIETTLGRILREPTQKAELAKVFPKVIEFYKDVYGDRSHIN